MVAAAPRGGPTSADDWWDNLLNMYRRFDSDEVPNVPVQVRFGDHAV